MSSSYRTNKHKIILHVYILLAYLVTFTARLASLGESLGVIGRSKLAVEPRPPRADVRNTNDGCLPIDEADGGRELLMLSTLASVFT